MRSFIGEIDLQRLTICCRSPEQVSERLDRLIQDIRERWHARVMEKGKEAASKESGDVLIVAHGHILRALALRWTRKELHEGPAFLLEAGGVGTLRYASLPRTGVIAVLPCAATSPRALANHVQFLSYEHHNIDEPAILLGGGFVVDIVENASQSSRQN